MRARASMAVFLITVAGAGSACNVIEPEGRQQATTFTTALTPQQTRARAEGWLAERALYRVTSSDPVSVRGEKQRPSSVRPGDQIDALSVTMAADAVLGTTVEVQALTFEVAESGLRNQADQVSREALADHAALMQALMQPAF